MRREPPIAPRWPPTATSSPANARCSMRCGAASSPSRAAECATRDEDRQRAAALVERLEAQLPDPNDEILLEGMPISIYGGG